MLIQNLSAPCLLQEIHNFDQSADIDAFLEREKIPKGHKVCKHEYTLIPDRCIVPKNSAKLQKDSSWRAFATCRLCRSHVDIILQYDDFADVPCPTDDQPFHHFKFIGRASKDTEGGEGIYQFRCTARQCMADLYLNFQRPFVKADDLTRFTSVFALKKRYADAKAKYPKAQERNAYDTLRVVRLAIINALAKATPKQIPEDNSTFSTVFGPESAGFLERLGFTRSPTHHWISPRPGSHTDAEADPGRSSLEDARDELNILMAARPQAEKNTWPEDFVVRFAQLDFAAILGIPQTMISRTNITQLLLLPDEPPFALAIDTHYRDLGIVKQFSTLQVRWAYEQQVQADPENLRRYLKALEDIASLRQNEELQTEAALIASQIDQIAPAIEEAYRMILIDPAHARLMSEDIIIDAYNRKQEKGNDTDKRTTREALKVIGRYRNSQLILKIAERDGSPPLSYENALKFLGAETDTTDDGIEALQTIKLADDPATATQLREAIKVVAEHRNSEYLRNVLAGTAPPPSQMDIDKAYRLVGLDPTQSLDDEQVQHLLDQIRVNLNEEPHRSVAFREALDIIAARTQNQAIRAYVNELSPTSLALMTSDLEEPRGLNNIGNTCYLASLLQYLYTVATVREIVKKIDEIGETVQDDVDLVKQVDEMPVSKEQVRRALQFARELDKLFTNLASTRASVVRPDIELARLTLRNVVGEQARRKSTLSLEKRPSPPVADKENKDGDAGTDDTIITTDIPEFKPEEDILMEDSETKSGEVAPTEGDVDMTASRTRDASPADSAFGDDRSSGPPAHDGKAPPVPPRPQYQSPPEQRQVERWAQQQDVREVLSNVLLQLRWAIKGYGLTEKGDQVDFVSERFYGTDESVTVKPTGEERVLNQFQELMPYLRESSDLYSILESAYDLTAVEGTDVFQYTEIRTIPHILHISVERARNDGTKCEEPLELPEKVYMDRFMLRPEILAKRRKAWSWKAELANLQQRREVLTKTSTDLNIPQTLSSTSEYLEEIAMNAEDLGLDVALMSDPELLAALGDSAESAQKEMNELDTEISVLEQKLKNLFADHTDFPYRLHAVFMHRSGSGRVDGGHWFIYIFDPKSKQWRRYNDESVQKVTDSHVFLKPTKEAARREGTASFVVYVRDDIADDLMETVYRVPEAEPEMTEVASEIPSADRGLPDWQAANALQQMASQAENYDVPRIPLDVWDHDMSGSGWT